MAGYVASLVLAGGKGTRLGKDKLSTVVGDQPLLQRVINAVSLISKSIFVVTAKGQEIKLPDTMQNKVILVSDIYPGIGALGGIHAGLVASDCRYNLALAADMPFLNPGLLRYLVEISLGFDVVMPRVSGNIEPLHAVYSRDCLPAIQEQLDRNERQIRSFLKRVKVRYVEEAEVDKFDPRHLSFFNVNTPDELAKANEIAAEIGEN